MHHVILLSLIYPFSQEDLLGALHVADSISATGETLENRETKDPCHLLSLQSHGRDRIYQICTQIHP